MAVQIWILRLRLYHIKYLDIVYNFATVFVDTNSKQFRAILTCLSSTKSGYPKQQAMNILYRESVSSNGRSLFH